MKLILFSLIVIFASSVVAEQAGQSPADVMNARLRDQIKKANQRIGEADAATAQAQADKVTAEAKAADLQSKLTLVTKDLKAETEKGKADKEAGEKAIKNLEAKLEAKEKDVEAYAAGVKKWTEYGTKAAESAKAMEAARDEALNKAIAADRKAQDHERKNREMYKLGTEILERYKNFGLGTALLAKEPFVGSMRVKFQNYVQDYGDKLATQRIKPGATKDVGAPPPASSGQAAKP